MTGQGTSGPGPDKKPARLKRRAEFLRAATGRKVHGSLFTVQVIGQEPEGMSPARIGYTVTKKVGNAVERNRIRRRLREVVRITSDLGIKPSHDYVIVARRAVLEQLFPALTSGLRSALARLDRANDVKRPSNPRPDSGFEQPRTKIDL